MMSDFWKKKMRKYFSLFDFDSDGFICKKDMVKMATRFARLGNADEQKTEHLKTIFVNVWELLVQNVEIENKEKITADDLIISIGNLRYSPQLMKLFNDMIRDYYDILDVSRDGYLQENEYKKILFQLGFPDQSFAKEAFKAIDVNGDGKLSLEEHANAFFDFLFSDDQTSPNRFFFGPIDE